MTASLKYIACNLDFQVRNARVRVMEESTEIFLYSSLRIQQYSAMKGPPQEIADGVGQRNTL